nr:hypothetical protein [Paraburkholderia sp. BL21I4N1]
MIRAFLTAWYWTFNFPAYPGRGFMNNLFARVLQLFSLLRTTDLPRETQSPVPAATNYSVSRSWPRIFSTQSRERCCEARSHNRKIIDYPAEWSWSREYIQHGQCGHIEGDDARQIEVFRFSRDDVTEYDMALYAAR